MSGYPRRSTSSPHSSQSNTPRYSGAHSNSSAFSKNAQPNEDWTQVSDLAERRRIQNRIAQRNYRQKLKKRLEELEHHAHSQSASPEPSPSREDGPGSNSGERQRPSEQPSSSSSRSQFDVQHLNLFGQSCDDDSRMLGYQFCAQPSPPPPPSPPLPDHSGYASVEHSKFSPHSQHLSTWQSQHQQRGQPYYSSPQPAGSSYYGSQVSPDLSAASTPPRSEAPFWTRQNDEGWGTWSYAPHNEQQQQQQQAPMQPWQQASPGWQAHSQDASSLKSNHDDNVLGWGHFDNGYPTPPSSADLINPTINPFFEEFLNIEST